MSHQISNGRIVETKPAPQVLPDLTAQLKAMEEMIAAQAEMIARLKSQPRGKGISGYSVSSGEKKGVNINGLRRFPIFLYVGEAEAILDDADRLRAFIKAHPELSRKG